MTTSSKGQFKRQISAIDLILVGVGSIIGSGWLFAAGKVAAVAGPAGSLSWVIGGIALLLLGLVYAELGAALPQAGGLVRYPYYTHGPVVSGMVSFITVIAFSSLIAIEVLAVRQYASGWWPALTQAGGDSPTLLGWFIQLILFVVFFLLNYWSIGVFAKSNTIITWFKFIVPTLVIVCLLSQLKGVNFDVRGFAPNGVSGVTSAVATGGVMFAYLGLTPLMALAGEVRRPQRNLPLALIGTTVASTIIYILLQIAFVGGVPTHVIANDGWSKVGQVFNLPYYDIAISLGFVWLAVLVTIDAVISPGGTGNIYMSTTPRVIYGWSRTGTFFQLFGKVDERTGIPRPALWLTFFLSIFWTLPFPSWDALISVVSSALIFSYALAPISAHALRLSNPDMHRPFFLKGLGIISPLAFVIASLILYWAGWQTISWLLGIQVLVFIVYLVFGKHLTATHTGFFEQLRSSLWLIFYYVLVMAISAAGSFGGSNALASPWDQIGVAVVALIAYYWAVYSARLPRASLPEYSEETT
ncbi:APC family permease [Salinisphaera hydrothermalis]|uniref:APC family permease n=1 Tax=Salinisphaera hydrothermalis TaxID=563188 RepID=UPI00334132EA